MRFLIGLVGLLLAGCTPTDYRKAADACSTVHAGMTEAQVLAIMGAPQRRDEPPARSGQIWLRYHEGGDLRPITIILAKSSHGYVVIDQTCGRQD
jgi:hypothetical protein